MSSSIKTILRGMSQFYGVHVSDEQLKIWCDGFAGDEIPFFAYCAARYMNDQNNTAFPLPPRKILEQKRVETDIQHSQLRSVSLPFGKKNNFNSNQTTTHSVTIGGQNE